MNGRHGIDSQKYLKKHTRGQYGTHTVYQQYRDELRCEREIITCNQDLVNMQAFQHTCFGARWTIYTHLQQHTSLPSFDNLSTLWVSARFNFGFISSLFINLCPIVLCGAIVSHWLYSVRLFSFDTKQFSPFRGPTNQFQMNYVSNRSFLTCQAEYDFRLWMCSKFNDEVSESHSLYSNIPNDYNGNILLLQNCRYPY